MNSRRNHFSVQSNLRISQNSRMRLRMLHLIFVVLAAWLVAGCQRNDTFAGRADPRPVRAIVSLSPGASEIVPGMVFRIPLLGRTANCNYPVHVTQAPIVMNGTRPNYDMIAKIEPSLVIYDPSLFSDDEIKKINEIGIDTFAIEGDTVDEFIICLFRFGSRISGETTMSEYVEKIRASMAKAKTVYGDAPKKKAAIVMADERGGHMIAGTKSFVADVVRIAGGDVVGPDSNKFEAMSVENMIAWNPEIIVTTENFKPLLTDQRLKSITAVQSGHLVPVNSDVLLRRGSRVDKLITALSVYMSEPIDVRTIK